MFTALTNFLEMLTILGNKTGRFCDGVTRRDFLKIGGLAMGGLSMPQILRAEAASGVRKILNQDPVEPVNLLGATGAPMLKRLAPVLAGLFGLLVVRQWLRCRRR